MSLDIDLENIFDSFETSDDETSKLAYIFYRNIPHSDSVNILDIFTVDAKNVEKKYLLKIKNEFSYSEKTSVFTEVLKEYATDNNWFLIYDENLDLEIELITEEYLNNEQTNEE